VLVAQVGDDGLALLDAVLADDAPPELRMLSAIELLRKVWVHNYVPTEGGLRWRTTDDGLPPATQFISSIRSRGSPGSKARDSMDRVQGPPHRDLRTRDPEPDYRRSTVLGPIADWASLPILGPVTLT
jgi:hypothetical protein